MPTRMPTKKELAFLIAPNEWYDMHGLERDGDMFLELHKNLYGRRPAGANLREHFEKVLKSLPGSKFRRGVHEPCLYFCPQLNLVLVHHVDDFRATGPPEGLKMLGEHLKECLFLKLGDPEGVGSQATFLGRTRYRLSGRHGHYT